MAGVYIHIPFCHGKCDYCDFYSLGAPVEELMRRYASALTAEWRMRRRELATEKISTVYIGGGTPSALPYPLLRQIIESIAEDGIDVNALDEFTIEANPENLTEEWVRQVASLGIGARERQTAPYGPKGERSAFNPGEIGNELQRGPHIRPPVAILRGMGKEYQNAVSLQSAALLRISALL